MKKLFFAVLFSSILTVAPTLQSQAAIWVVVKAALKKAIKAIDLAIQQQQNKVLWLQNAQKEMENTMSKLKLDQISDWVEKQRSLYQDYFDELQKVKSIIGYYDRAKQITAVQACIISEYQRAFALFKKDAHFSGEEIIYMRKVYAGMLETSARNLDRLELVINSFRTQMTDAKRLEMIDAAFTGMSSVYNDLKQFNSQNIVLSLQRTKDNNDLTTIKALYNIR